MSQPQDLKKFIGEIFAATNAMEDKAQVQTHLKKFWCPAMRAIFEVAYHPKVQWALPAGEPPYQPDTSPYGYHSTNLYTATTRFSDFLKCPRTIPNEIVRERVFIQMLESLPKDEARIVLNAKERNLTIGHKWLTYDLIAETFPGVLPARVQSPLDVSVSGGADSLPSPTEEAPTPPVKRGRGRPKGSGKKKTTAQGTGANA